MGLFLDVLICSLSLFQKSANYSLWAKASSLPAFVNKASLEHSHACSFTCCLGLLSCSSTGAEEL